MYKVFLFWNMGISILFFLHLKWHADIESEPCCCEVKHD